MVEEVLVSVSLVIVVAAILTVIARVIKQPPIIAYLVSGVIVGPLVFGLINPAGNSGALMQIFAHIGVAFLLFIVGLSLDFRVLKEVGKVSVLTGIAEIIITCGIGVLIAIGLGFSSITALYLGVILAFSSTVVVVKILSDKKEIHTLHGRITLGILIVEDFVAAIALMVIPLIQGRSNFNFVFYKFVVAIALIGIIFLVAALVLNRVLDYLARSQDALFLFGIAWALVLATIFNFLGFSLEIGALIAGMSLASSRYTFELGGKIKPLRDFFVVLFFVFFGSQLTREINSELIKNALIFSFFIFIGKPIIVMSLLRFFGYKKRTNFLAGANLAQISEFSLIIALLGFNLGQLSQQTMNLAILVALITIGLSSYSIHYSHWIFNQFSGFLGIFEGKKQASNERKEKHYSIALFGYHRIGYKVLNALKKTRVPFVVVDHNPRVVLALLKEGIDCIYGDACDKEFLNEIRFERIKLAISTIPDEEANCAIIEKIKELHAGTIFIATTEQPRNALELYEKGANYVLVPQHLGGDYAAHMISKLGVDKKEYNKIRSEHIKELKKAKNESNFM
jgi:Kef-type K+ transport system membrane component KefB